MRRHVYRRLAVFAAGIGLTVAAGVSPAHAAPAQSPDGLRQIAVRQSLLGTHTWYQQTYRGLPVLGGYYATHKDASTGAVTVQDGRQAVHGLATDVAAIAQDKAKSMVTGRLHGTAKRSELVVVPGATAKLAWLVLTGTEKGTVQSVVDAGTGATLAEKNTVQEATGVGQVFDPNPVATLQDESLTDNDNADSPAFAAAYRVVPLDQMGAGAKVLVGAYANNISNNPVSSTNRIFVYNRSQRGFEQVMGYYSITTAQEYIHQIGFTDVNNEPQDYRTTGFSGDNSFYDPSDDTITFGTGGVDDAEDAEVIWHEYGHAIQDAQVPGYGTSEEAGAIGEGFGDYWAFTMSQADSEDTAVTPLACIADWDSTSYTDGTPHCLRRVDGTKMYPGDLDGEVHDDGEIWSRALWDINGALGRNRANRVILEAHFGFAPDTSIPAAANHTVATANLLYGAGAAKKVEAAFHARGII
jgi:Zn-dependent metalloprotease